jgi:tetratricopeptide (TPR) repeat protein
MVISSAIKAGGLPQGAKTVGRASVGRAASVLSVVVAGGLLSGCHSVPADNGCLPLDQNGKVTAAALYNAGNALYRQGKPDAAINCYNWAIRVKSDYSAAWNNKGAALKDQGKYEKALDSFYQAFRYDPENFQALHNKCLAYRLLGREMIAKFCFEQYWNLTER